MNHKSIAKRSLLSVKLLLFLFAVFCLFSMSSAGHHLHHGAEHTGEQHSKGDHPWAKYVGVHSDEAVKAIKEENPSLNVHVVPKDSMVTMDFRPDRVRVFVDENKHVVRTPTVG